MSPEFWSVISMGVVILIAIATSNRSLRREMDRLSERIDRLSERFNRLSERLDGLNERVNELSERLDRLSKRVDRLSERVDGLSERLGRVEGLLEGLGLTRWQRAGKGPGDETPTPVLPQS